MHFVRSTQTAASRVFPESPIAQVFVDFLHGYLAFSAYAALTAGLFGLGWLALAAACVLGFCHILATLWLRDRGADFTHIPTARSAIDRAATAVASRWEARRARAHATAY
jgi:hypothetical protein